MCNNKKTVNLKRKIIKTLEKEFPNKQILYTNKYQIEDETGKIIPNDYDSYALSMLGINKNRECHIFIVFSKEFDMYIVHYMGYSISRSVKYIRQNLKEYLKNTVRSLHKIDAFDYEVDEECDLCFETCDNIYLMYRCDRCFYTICMDCIEKLDTSEASVTLCEETNETISFCMKYDCPLCKKNIRWVYDGDTCRYTLE